MLQGTKERILAARGGGLWQLRAAEIMLLLAANLGQRKEKRERENRERESECSLGFLV